MSQFDLVAIGNAIVDILAQTSDEFIASQSPYNMAKGSMNLIDADRAKFLYSQIGPAVEMSGGSAGNTMAAFASFGGKGAYIGKVANDQLGNIFRHDMNAIGVHFQTPALENSAPTATSLILITPDAQRTMNTYLGACVQLSPDDIDEAVIAQSAVTYLEGYLFDPALAKKAFYKAADIVQKSGKLLSLTLSDSFCVNRHRDDFRNLVKNHVNILFSNEDEIKALYETNDTQQAAQMVRGECDICVITRSASGSLIVTPDAIHDVQATKPAQLVDTTGAGDAYAAGFLYGYTQGKSLPECGALGSLAAAEVISHIGPRPATSLKELMTKAA